MKTKTTRRLAAAALLGACVLVTASPASAAASTDLPAGIACPDFPLRIAGSDGRVRVKEFTDKSGKVVLRILQVATGVVLTYTNLTTQKSVSIKTSGSVWHIVNNPDETQTWTMTGHNGLILFPTDIPAGPTTTQYNGRVVFNFDPANGFAEVISTSGRARDICAELS
jgi:hypothetical protein